MAKPFRAFKKTSDSYYETNFGVSRAFGARNTKIGCLKARQRRAFKQPIFIMRTAAKNLTGFGFQFTKVQSPFGELV